MEKLKSKPILVAIRKGTCVFEDAEGETYFATSRVANDIVNGVKDIFVNRNVEVNGHSIGDWLATPSRF